jgi:hypothetical protein
MDKSQLLNWKPEESSPAVENATLVTPLDAVLVRILVSQHLKKATKFNSKMLLSLNHNR